jgi:hypothetical protein
VVVIARGMFTVWLDVPPEHEAEFNDWYNLEHIAQMTGLPGFTGARRYFSEAGGMRYLAWYDTLDERVESGPAFNHVVAHPTGWSTRIRRFYGDQRERMNFRLMRDVGTVPKEDTPWLYIVHTDIPDHIVDEYNDWYDREHLPRLVTVPGVIRARRYAATAGNPRYLTAYELTDPDAFESPAGLKARKTPWTEKMRSLFTNTRRRMCKLILPTVAGSAAAR